MLSCYLSVLKQIFYDMFGVIQKLLCQLVMLRITERNCFYIVHRQLDDLCAGIGQN